MRLTALESPASGSAGSARSPRGSAQPPQGMGAGASPLGAQPSSAGRWERAGAPSPGSGKSPAGMRTYDNRLFNNDD